METRRTTHIVIMTTGGTIDKSYDEFQGTLFNRESLVNDYVLERLRHPYTEFLIGPIMAKDSLRMVEQDRQKILAEIQKKLPLGHPILVVHGTDTMVRTARYCQENCPEVGVPIVFTGAMRPIGLQDSDGHQNIAEGLMACKLLNAGWYISFHGEVYEAHRAEKVRHLATFGPLSP